MLLPGSFLPKENHNSLPLNERQGIASLYFSVDICREAVTGMKLTIGNYLLYDIFGVCERSALGHS